MIHRGSRIRRPGTEPRPRSQCDSRLGVWLASREGYQVLHGCGMRRGSRGIRLPDAGLGLPPRLIEVALPLDDINRAAAREKFIRHGQPSTLQPWWARRPPAAAHAVPTTRLADGPSGRPDAFLRPEDQNLERERLFGEGSFRPEGPRSHPRSDGRRRVGGFAPTGPTDGFRAPEPPGATRGTAGRVALPADILPIRRGLGPPEFGPDGRRSMTRAEIVLAAVAAGGRGVAIDGFRVQKLLFLIDAEISDLVEGPHFDFVAADYGPFDESLYSVLGDLGRAGWVAQAPTNGYTNYFLTPQGGVEGGCILGTLCSEARQFIESAGDVAPAEHIPSHPDRDQSQVPRKWPETALRPSSKLPCPGRRAASRHSCRVSRAASISPVTSIRRSPRSRRNRRMRWPFVRTGRRSGTISNGRSRPSARQSRRGDEAPELTRAAGSGPDTSGSRSGTAASIQRSGEWTYRRMKSKQSN